MSAELTRQIVEAIIGLMGLLITGFLIPYLKQKYSVEKRNQAFQLVRIAVQSVEQIAIATGMSGKEKKAEVIRFLNSYGVKMNAEEMDRMIEAAVLELGAWEKAAVEP